MEPVDLDFEEADLELPSEPMTLLMGPSHPAMHGTIRMVLKLDGETVQDVDIQPGYLHRAFEKMSERGTWSQVFPVHRPAQLRVAAAQQRGLRPRGGEAPRRRPCRARARSSG
jgi:NADH:ubiquinone oxidoreductase subunit D